MSATMLDGTKVAVTLSQIVKMAYMAGWRQGDSEADEAAEEVVATQWIDD